MVIRIAGECGALLECGFGGVGITAGSELLRRLISIGFRDNDRARIGHHHRAFSRAGLMGIARPDMVAHTHVQIARAGAAASVPLAGGQSAHPHH